MGVFGSKRVEVPGGYLETDPQRMAENRAIQRLTGQEHNLYTDVAFSWRGPTRKLMDGRRILIRGKGDQTTAEWY